MGGDLVKTGGEEFAAASAASPTIKWRKSRQEFAKKTFLFLRLAKNLRTEVSLFFQEAFVHHMNSFFFK